MKPHLLIWADLSPAQKDKAIKHRLDSLLTSTVEGAITWGESQPLFDAALERAEVMRTPWFAGEYVMEACGDLLTQVATIEAQQLRYINPMFQSTISDCVLLNN